MPMKEESRQTDLPALSPAEKDLLTDLRSVNIRMTLPREERIEDFLKQVKNPYLFRCGDMVVQSVYPDTEMTLADRLRRQPGVETTPADWLRQDPEAERTRAEREADRLRRQPGML
ncbi:MAG: hypothetical protein LBQ15_11505 [Clostridium sp.]|jgi:hypothetical protein|nr:hypothetical protein [Clostridium sp.]